MTAFLEKQQTTTTRRQNRDLQLAKKKQTVLSTNLAVSQTYHFHYVPTRHRQLVVASQESSCFWDSATVWENSDLNITRPTCIRHMKSVICFTLLLSTSHDQTSTHHVAPMSSYLSRHHPFHGSDQRCHSFLSKYVTDGRTDGVTQSWLMLAALPPTLVVSAPYAPLIMMFEHFLDWRMWSPYSMKASAQNHMSKFNTRKVWLLVSSWFQQAFWLVDWFLCLFMVWLVNEKKNSS